MSNLDTTYMGLALRSPLVASASPLTGRLESLERIERAGAGAAVLPSLFEEQITHDQLEVDRVLASGAESFPEALSYFPELDDYNAGPDAYLRLVEQAKSKLEIPVIASINGATPGGWTRYAQLMEDAGADAIELNVYRIAARPDTTGRQVEQSYIDLVAAVSSAVKVPVAVKIGPYFSALTHTARELAFAGARALVLFNRFYQPNLDLETLGVAPHLVLSHSDELRLPLRWTAILHGRVDTDLALTTGVHTWQDATKALLAGATVAMMTSALLEHGPDHIATVEQGLRKWLDEHEYASVDQLRGSVSQGASDDPEQFERTNYMRTLASYSSDV